MPAPATKPSGPPVLVCKPTDEGVLVYSPSDPKTQNLVTTTPEGLTCTCDEFADNDGRACQHIEAARELLPERTPPKHDAPHEVAEPNSPTMLLKRSVSPDGRIDSLSVEFSCPVGGLNEETILKKARRALSLQEAITGEFKQSTPEPEGHDNAPKNEHRQHGNANGNGNGNSNGAQEATILEVGGMQTRFGWKMFLLLDVDGDRLKLFGSKKQIGDQLAAAGYREESRNLEVGTRLDLPCRAFTKETDDGRYTNVEKLLPPARNGARNGARR